MLYLSQGCCTIKPALKQRIVWHFSMVIGFKHLYVTTDSSNYYSEKNKKKNKDRGDGKEMPSLQFRSFSFRLTMNNNTADYGYLMKHVSHKLNAQALCSMNNEQQYIGTW